MGKTYPNPLEGKKDKVSMGYLLRQAAIAYRIRLERALMDLKVTPPQFYVLIKLAAYPGISNADLARLTLLTPQSLSVTIANLERSGWVLRRPHEAHGRIQRIELTEEGKRLLAQAKDRSRGLQEQLMEGFTPDQEQTIRDWLARVASLGIAYDG